MSPALAGRFSTTAPPGKPRATVLMELCRIRFVIWKGHRAVAWQKEAGREGIWDFSSSGWVAKVGEVSRFGRHSFPATKGPQAWL